MELLWTALPQTNDFETPFSLDVPDFTDQWWNRQVDRVQGQRSDFLSFTLHGEEVARAEVDRDTIDNIYVGLTPAPQVVELVFFEVRQSHRRKGIGRTAVDLITERYDGEMLIAFSQCADDFWAGIGWRHHPREDGSSDYRPLFVFDGRE